MDIAVYVAGVTGPGPLEDSVAAARRPRRGASTECGPRRRSAGTASPCSRSSAPRSRASGSAPRWCRFRSGTRSCSPGRRSASRPPSAGGSPSGSAPAWASWSRGCSGCRASVPRGGCASTSACSRRYCAVSRSSTTARRSPPWQVQLPEMTPPQVLLAALGPSMLQIAGEQADGTVTWMAGPRTLGQHVVPTLTRAAQEAGRRSPGGRRRPRLRDRRRGQCPVADRGTVRAGRTGPRVPGCARPGRRGRAARVAAIGSEAAVAVQLRRLADAGVTELAAAPFGTPAEQARTMALLADLHHRGRRAPAAADGRRPSGDSRAHRTARTPRRRPPARGPRPPAHRRCRL